MDSTSNAIDEQVNNKKREFIRKNQYEYAGIFLIKKEDGLHKVLMQKHPSKNRSKEKEVFSFIGGGKNNYPTAQSTAVNQFCLRNYILDDSIKYKLFWTLMHSYTSFEIWYPSGKYILYILKYDIDNSILKENIKWIPIKEFLGIENNNKYHFCKFVRNFVKNNIKFQKIIKSYNDMDNINVN